MQIKTLKMEKTDKALACLVRIKKVGGGGGKDCFINSYVMLKYYTFCPVLPDTRNSIAVFEGSQASAVCQSDKNDIEMKCSLELCKQCVPIRRSSYLTESSLSVVQGN